ncbi:hypothetical protein [Cloacibacillus evryensis]|uniref:hypothetical protein n=1 Tax=Cloacibacillus evryensis TaxID=508460 RepID=UPI0026DF6824|nr:hypothetical protein [Cloacibacillus evryensis]
MSAPTLPADFKMATVLIEENNKYQMDCSSAVSATSEIHALYNSSCASILSDVDFFIENEKTFISVEYKNACIKGVCKGCGGIGLFL